jgi:sugar phosphate isomerase/epimerase
MTDITRRGLLKSALVTGATARIAFAKRDNLRIGVTDWNLDRGADPESVPLAARLGFEGVQVSFGQKLADGKMPADNPDTIARYLKLSKDNNIPIDGTCVDRLHTDGLKSTKAGQKWVLDSIRLTKDLHTKVLLLPFFGKWALKNREEMDHTGDVLRDLAPEAEKAGVILGLEDTISAEDNVRIMDRARSKNILVYYDVGNSTENGFDVVKEIRWLGKDRICQFHLKDNPHFLGEGKIQFAPIIHAIRDIGYSGYANLETDAGKNTLEADMRRNLLYIRNVMASA